VAVTHLFPTINQIVLQLTIPKVDVEDKRIWKASIFGELSFKEAYLYKSPISQHFEWAKKVWSADISPSKSLLAWRLMHNKLPTDENMMGRGCSIASICSSCNTSPESTFHLFFQCSLAMKLWSWLASLLNTNLQFNSVEDIWKLCNKIWTPQCKVVVQAVIINILSTIWFIRNQARFKDKKIH